MNNNDRFTRLRYAFDFKDRDMVEIFALGGMEVGESTILKFLNRLDEDTYEETLSDFQFESFLNGFITLKRGPSDLPVAYELNAGNVNNVMLKKLKIALSMTSEDILDTWLAIDLVVTKSELSAFLRKEGHRNYTRCEDNFARNFIKGIMTQNRK